jgi:hypothetical protein
MENRTAGFEVRSMPEARHLSQTPPLNDEL